MSTTLEGTHRFKVARFMFAPGKAANAGSVAVSHDKMSQHSERRSWKEKELRQMLFDIMQGITRCIADGDQCHGLVDYVEGAISPASGKWWMPCSFLASSETRQGKGTAIIQGFDQP